MDRFREIEFEEIVRRLQIFYFRYEDFYERLKKDKISLYTFIKVHVSI